MSRITPHFVSDSMTKPLYFVGLEGPRVVLESMATPLSLAWLANYRTSQGRPVLIVPPFAPGVSTLELSLACLLYTSPSPRDRTRSRMPSSA